MQLTIAFYDLQVQGDGVEVVGAPVGPLQMNQFIVACTKTKVAAMVDSGDEDPTRFRDFLEYRGYTLTHLLQVISASTRDHRSIQTEHMTSTPHLQNVV
jgi:hypothetical protein